MAWSADGTLLAATGRDRQVRLWAPATGTTITTLTGKNDHVRAVACSPTAPFWPPPQSEARSCCTTATAQTACTYGSRAQSLSPGSCTVGMTTTDSHQLMSDTWCSDCPVRREPAPYREGRLARLRGGQLRLSPLTRSADDRPRA
ncbi:MAG: WD40 domain-containing protein [Actinobacteria bacterium]|nr:WD40 domain-containing protein [Actinomycetota bacterium]